MKKINILSAIILMFAAIGFTSCESEPVDPLLIDNQPQPTAPASFKVDFSGETFVADEVQAVIVDGLIVISAAQGNEAVTLTVPGTTTGTYSGMQALMVYHPTLTSEYQYWNVDDELNPTGSITVTSINTTNHTISGIFNFTGYWSNMDENLPSIAFTNGTFENIPYTTQAVNPGDDQYMSAVVDGVEKDFSFITSLEAGGNLSFSGTIVSPSTSINIMVPIDITPGTYSLAGDEFNDPKAIYSNFSDFPYESTSGSITITSNSNGWIEGTFQFTADDGEGNTVQVTNGEFNVELP